MDMCYDMNEMHATGILVCLAEHAAPCELYDAPISEETTGGPLVLHLHPTTPVRALTLRETLDQIECLQLNWGPAIASWGAPKARMVLKALMARLGCIAHHAYRIGADEVLDDPQVRPHMQPPKGLK